MIQNRRNETWKAIRRLRRKQGESALLEGPLLLAEALDAGIDLELVVATPAFSDSDSGRALLSRLPRPAVAIEPLLLEELADTDSPRGVLAVCTLLRGGAQRLPRVEQGLYVYLDAVQDPGNLGAIARIAEAFGAVGLALAPGCAHPNHPRALRGSAGSLLRIPTARDLTAVELSAYLAPLSPRWAALAAHGGEPLPASRPPGSWVVVLGAEGRGVSSSLSSQLTASWTIPLAPRVESLNVAVAAGIALYALRRQQAAGAALRPR